MKPLCVELFAGTFGWSQGWLELGGRSVGFDLEHLPHHGKVPENAELVIQDCLTLHGSQFKDADLILASPPCTQYSYLAMPWSRSAPTGECIACRGTGLRPAGSNCESICLECEGEGVIHNSKAAKALRKKWETEGPDNRLFDACFRIQREALIATGYICEACGAPDEPRIEMTAPAGHQHSDDLAEYAPCSECLNKSKRYIPLIVENVRGAVPWVGREKAKFGSFYLWGDVGMVGNRVFAGRDLTDVMAGRGRFGMGVAPESGELKGHGSTWFGIQSNGDTYDQREVNPVSGQKREGRNFHTWALTGGAVSSPSYHGGDHETRGVGMGIKTPGRSLSKGAANKFGTHNMGSAEKIFAELKGGTKIGGDWFSDPNSTCRKHGSHSNARKAASAMIAKIPLALSSYIARVHHPGIPAAVEPARLSALESAAATLTPLGR